MDTAIAPSTTLGDLVTAHPDLAGRAGGQGPPRPVAADGCATYQALYQALEAVEADTHLHVHIENNRLFPMVLELEPGLVA